MKNLISIKNLTTDEILKIMRVAENFEKNKRKSTSFNKNVCMMFFENSTRTRFSFEMASHNLGLRIFNFNSSNTSLSKGETVLDTIENLYAIGINACIIRSKEAVIGNLLSSKMRFINAGEGSNSHPTQALLDFYTIKKHFDDLTGKKVVIVGDIKHSRVAKSNVELLSRFGADIILVAPKYFQDETIENVRFSENLNEELKNADITMGLRIQRERIEESIPFSDYINNFQINEKNINKNSLLMHPGPVNRDVEVSSNLLDSDMGETILEQAKNGVFVRMAVIDLILGEEYDTNC